MLTAFVKSELYKNIESIALSASNYQQLTISGPKGVGKSTTIIALWQELIKQEDITVILTSPKAVKYRQILPVKKYNLALVQDFPELVNIIETEVFTEPFQYINFYTNV